jgi:hypothetical protein
MVELDGNFALGCKLEWITPKYIYINVCYNENIL